MLNSRVKYVVFYTENNRENRHGALSAKSKIDYISQILTQENFKVEIVSASWTNNLYGIYKGSKNNLSKNILLRQFFTFGSKNRIGRCLKYFVSLFQIFLYLLIFTKKDENIMIYHSIILYFPIKLLKKMKKINIILEVEEIYQDIQLMPNYMKKIEQKLFDIADMYIFSTELLNEKLNKKNKPHVVIYGTYKVEEKITSKFTDGKIHLVYAGTLDCRKGGAQVAISTGEYLNEKFHIHILGFGDEKEKKEVKKLIEETQKKTNCQITYEGILFGADYIKFIQKCHLGLSTQVSIGEYNDSSFPSKILSYMSNGLRVLSTKIKVLEVSKINKLLYFYDSHNPKDIADEILKINFNDNYNGQMEIEFLNREFKKNINKILGLKNG